MGHLWVMTLSLCSTLLLLGWAHNWSTANTWTMNEISVSYAARYMRALDIIVLVRVLHRNRLNSWLSHTHTQDGVAPVRDVCYNIRIKRLSALVCVNVCYCFFLLGCSRSSLLCGFSLVALHGLLVAVAFLAAEHGLLPSSRAQAQ